MYRSVLTQGRCVSRWENTCNHLKCDLTRKSCHPVQKTSKWSWKLWLKKYLKLLDVCVRNTECTSSETCFFPPGLYLLEHLWGWHQEDKCQKCLLQKIIKPHWCPPTKSPQTPQKKKPVTVFCCLCIRCHTWTRKIERNQAWNSLIGSVDASLFPPRSLVKVCVCHSVCVSVCSPSTFWF